MSNYPLTLPVCLNDPNSKSIHRRCAVSNLSLGVSPRSLPQISKRNPNQLFKRGLTKEQKKPFYTIITQLFGGRAKGSDPEMMRLTTAYLGQISRAETYDDMLLSIEYAYDEPRANLADIEVQPKDKYVQELQRLFPRRAPRVDRFWRDQYKEYWIELRHAETTEEKKSIMERARKAKDTTHMEPSGAGSSNQAAQRPRPMNPASEHLIEPSGAESSNQAAQRPPPVNPAHQHLISDAALQQLFHEISQTSDDTDKMVHMGSNGYSLKYDAMYDLICWGGPKGEIYYWQDGQKYVLEEGKATAPAPWAFWLDI